MSESRQDYFERHGYEYQEILRILELEDIRRRTNKKVEDIHHLVAREMGGSQSKKNRIKLPRGQHEAHHRIYGNDLPHDQVITNLEFNETTFSKEMRELQQSIRADIGDLLKSDKLYRSGIIL